MMKIDGDIRIDEDEIGGAIKIQYEEALGTDP